MQYVRWIAREALVRGHSVSLVTLANCLEHPSYLTLQQECEGQIRTKTLISRRNLSSEKWLQKSTTVGFAGREFLYRNLFATYFRALSKDEYPDVFFIPYLDYCAYAVGLLGSPFGDVPWGGIVLRPAFHFDSVGVKGPNSQLHPLKQRLFFRTLSDKRLRRLFTIDESLVRFAGVKNQKLIDKLRFVPEPVQFRGRHTRTEARRHLGISADVMVLLVYGELTTRKGVDALLNAARKPGFPAELEILLAGKQDERIKLLLRSSQARALREAGRLHELDGYITDEETHMVFRAADMVWLGYRGHYTASGVLIQAGMMGLPIVACDAGLIGWKTRKHKLGLTISIDDAGAVAGAISKLTRDHNLRNESGENGKKLSVTHSLENFARVACDGLSLD
jgi:glycosyltransferase involved in cell wall biosynthesis